MRSSLRCRLPDTNERIGHGSVERPADGRDASGSLSTVPLACNLAVIVAKQEIVQNALVCSAVRSHDPIRMKMHQRLPYGHGGGCNDALLPERGPGARDPL